MKKLCSVLITILGIFCLSVVICNSVYADDIEKAKQLIEDGWWDDARDLLENVVKSNPKNARAHCLLGKIYLILEDHDNAEKYCKNAVKLDEDNSEYHFWLGNAVGLKAQKGSILKVLFRAKKTKKEFENAILLDPEYVRARFGLLQYLLRAPGIAGGDKDKARLQADTIALYDSIQGHYAWSLVYELNDEDFSQAEAELFKAIELEPSNKDSYYKLGSFYQRWYKYSQAESTYVKMFSTDSTEVKALYQLGYIYQEKREHDDAVAAFEKILTVDSTEMGAFYQIGKTSVLSKTDLNRAEQCFKKYLQAKLKGWWPDKASAHWRLAMVYDLRGETELAMTELEKGLKLKPKHDEMKKMKKELKKILKKKHR